MHQLGLKHGGICNVGHHDHDAGDLTLFVAHGTQVDGELPHPAVVEHDGQLQVIYLLSCQGRFQSGGQGTATGWRYQFGERLAQDLLRVVSTAFIPAAVGICDLAGGISNQNDALGIVDDLGVEITLALQVGLRVLQFRNVQDQATKLHYLALTVTHGECILQRMDGGAVLAPQSFLEIAQFAGLLQSGAKGIAFLGLEIQFLGNINLQ